MLAAARQTLAALSVRVRPSPDNKNEATVETRTTKQTAAREWPEQWPMLREKF